MCVFLYNCFHCVLAAAQLVDLDDFVEMTKKYAQGIAPQAGGPVTARAESPKPGDRSAEVKDPQSASTAITRHRKAVDAVSTVNQR